MATKPQPTSRHLTIQHREASVWIGTYPKDKRRRGGREAKQVNRSKQGVWCKYQVKSCV